MLHMHWALSLHVSISTFRFHREKLLLDVLCEGALLCTWASIVIHCPPFILAILINQTRSWEMHCAFFFSAFIYQTKVFHHPGLRHGQLPYAALVTASATCKCVYHVYLTMYLVVQCQASLERSKVLLYMVI